MAKILKVADMRDLEAQVIEGKITYGRMLELIEAKILEQCILKDDLLAHIDKLIEGAQKQEATFKESEMGISELTSGAMAMAYQIVRNFVGRHAPEIEAAKNKISEAARSLGQYENQEKKTHHWKRTKSEISPKEWKAHCESMANEMKVAQVHLQMQCPKCFTKWNIEIPALYKETFCPKCGG